MFDEVKDKLQELEAKMPADSLSQAIQERLARLEDSVKDVPEIPEKYVAAGDFPGSITIPGTDAMIKLGGRVRMSIVQSLDPLGVDDRFITATIPVEDEDFKTATEGLVFSLRASRLNFDFRTPTGVGFIRAFIEGDFAGSGDTFRLRHAYGQFKRILIGKTWSTFADPLAQPADIDFEGVNSQVLFRQPQVRWTQYIGDHTSLALAVENPSVDVTGGKGESQAPDTVVRYLWQHTNGHLQGVAMLRQIRARWEDDFRVTTSQWGVSLGFSGDISLPFWNKDDNVKYQINYGQGIGHYMKDLESAGGQAGVFTDTGELELLEALGFYIAYEHHWSKNFHSSLIYGHVQVHNLEAQDDSAYSRANRYAANFIYSPISRLDIGFEFLYGDRKNKDLQKGKATQIQLAGTFQF